ncbi:hypothetical protein AAGG74_18450 [Bacillus mexicanus]|uniref:hypothetical protein n=1 Tax=Bacillus mexicanus TaxID=2834415 RepID=UPI003D22C95E
MFKKVRVTLMFMAFFMILSPLQAYAASSDTKETARMVTSDGFFTTYKNDAEKCAINGDAKDFFSFSKDKKIEENKDSKEDSNFALDMLSSIFDGALQGIKGWVSSGTTALCNLDDTLGLFSQIYIFTNPVNVTHVEALMSVTGIVQWISLTLMVFGILFFGFRIMTGQSEIDPFPFALRYFLSMFLVYYAPYFVQDILNLNNQIINALANYQVSMGGGVSTTAGAVIPLSLVGFIVNAADQGALGWLSMLVLLIVVVMTFIPMLKLVVWWYVRLFKIFLYTAISPLMFASIAFPEFKYTFSGYISSLIKEIFSQFFVMLAVLITGAFICELPNLANTLNLGIIGLGLALYAAFNFLHEVPKFATDLLEGKVGGPHLDTIAGGVHGMRSRLGKSARVNTKQMLGKSQIGRNIRSGVGNKTRTLRTMARHTNFGSNKFRIKK